MRIGLPALQRLRRAGHNEQHTRLDTLLTLIATLDDTCLLSRGAPPPLPGCRRVPDRCFNSAEAQRQQGAPH
ncbi:triphosphoribosyl-dephospho-CoA synthase [Neopusillimonas aromaticivorans]|nr:triphosphoribosyl-dephospho-CoA synthase [Neopusillimonas aromaticivorans]WJJ92562.1 triphosphoribosyl-dephospho-CoA synthase [Neopusillimonas aromaticivorans]